MKIIAINGIIASWEMESESNVTQATLKKSLDDANGEDVLITINSPGGSVFEGLGMFSLIRNYPGHVETRIISLAASMGSVLALAGNKMSAENTALYFIHNAQGVGFGDYRDLLNESEFLKDVSSLIANLYAEYTSLTIKEAQDFMDDDSQFFGADLELLGFEIVQTGNEPNQAVARVTAKSRFADVTGKLAKDNQTYDLEKIAACLDLEKYGLKKGNPIEKGAGISAEGTAEARPPLKDITPTGNTPAEAGENNREVIMTLSALLEANPAAKLEYNNAIAEAGRQGETKGKADIEARIKKASAYFGTDYSDKIKGIAAEVITGEKSVETLEAVVAVMDMNAENVASAAAQGETGDQGDTNAGAGDKTAEAEAEFQAKKARIGG